MKRPLSDNWWYIERPIPLPLILFAIAVGLVAWWISGLPFWPL